MIFTSLCSYRYLVSPVQSFYTRMPDRIWYLLQRKVPINSLISVTYDFKKIKIFLNNSVLFYHINIFAIILVRANIFKIFSTASSLRIPLIAFRMMSTASCSSESSSRSSLLVPDFTISIAGNTRFSESFLSSTSSMLRFP